MDKIDCIHVAAVLEDSGCQLEILKHLSPRCSEVRPSRSSNLFSSDVRYIHIQSLTKVFSSRKEGFSVFVFEVVKKCFLEHTSRISPDRNRLQNILHETAAEILKEGTFKCLESFVKDQNIQAHCNRDIQSDINNDSDKNIEKLQKFLQNIKKTKTKELKKRKEVIAHLKDQIQEVKTKTNIEKNYIYKTVETEVKMVKKQCDLSEMEIQNLVEQLKANIEVENQINAEMGPFLRGYIKKLKDDVEMWRQKSDEEIAAKQQELDNLKNIRAKDIERTKELQLLCYEYEKVIVEDRVEKEKEKRRADQQIEEQEAATKIQCWWKGVMVRKSLGPYKPKKKGKGNGNKSGKKIKKESKGK